MACEHCKREHARCRVLYTLPSRDGIVERTGELMYLCGLCLSGVRIGLKGMPGVELSYTSLGGPDASV